MLSPSLPPPFRLGVNFPLIAPLIHIIFFISPLFHLIPFSLPSCSSASFIPFCSILLFSFNPFSVLLSPSKGVFYFWFIFNLCFVFYQTLFCFIVLPPLFLFNVVDLLCSFLPPVWTLFSSRTQSVHPFFIRTNTTLIHEPIAL